MDSFLLVAQPLVVSQKTNAPFLTFGFHLLLFPRLLLVAQPPHAENASNSPPLSEAMRFWYPFHSGSGRLLCGITPTR